MPFAIFVGRLRPGVSQEEFANWITQSDYPAVEQIPSVISQRIFLSDKEAVFGDFPVFEYVEVIEFTDRHAYLQDLATNPAAQKIKNELPRFVDMGSLRNSYFRFVPPGVG